MDFYSLFVALGIFLTMDAPSGSPAPRSQFTDPGSPHIVFEETFEGNIPFAKVHAFETGHWSYALQYVSHPVYRGAKAVRFEIREDQELVKNGKRSEVVIIKELPGKNMWYSFAVYFPIEGYATDMQREVINQWYQHGTPATSLRVQNDRLLLETGNEKENRKAVDIGAVTREVWHEFVFHFIHSHGADGLIEVWLDGKKVAVHNGGNMYNDVMPKWKIGIYKAAYKHGTANTARRVLYFDNIKVGNKNATYDEMLPAKSK